MTIRPILEVRDLRVEIADRGRTFSPVDGVSFSVKRGEALGVVGESGSGKTLTLRAILGLLPPNASLQEGEIVLSEDGTGEAPSARTMRRAHGLAMIFQEPMSALNPLMRVGKLIGDAYRATHRASRTTIRAKVLALMKEVGIPAAEERVRAYPHQLSGGLRQRVMIAMALATEPRVLLCDEPTTALDVTVQQQILALLNRIRDERGLALVYVTHDLAVIGQVCDRVAVMYAGRIMETGSVRAVFSNPSHPYTHLLLRSVPTMEIGGDRLMTIPGSPPDPRAFPEGCRFHPRCPMAQPDCLGGGPCELSPIGSARETACIHYDEMEVRLEGGGGA